LFFAPVAQKERDVKTNNAKRNAKTRDAEKSDANRLLSMAHGLAAHHGDTATITAKTIDRDAFGENPWVYVLVLEVDGAVIGYSALCPLIHFQAGIRGIDIHHLFVEKEFRGLGLGRQLINASIRKARELSCGYMKVGTHPDNKDAQATYLACGFVRQDASNPRFHISL
tara:strand:+ start:233 stop:739 length:507 start_codon:yes stop_codon:yes gene_type:complete